MKTSTQVALAVALMVLLSSTGYAMGQASTVATASSLPSMILAMDRPAVESAVSPGAGPETSSRPMSRAAPAPRMATTTTNPEITATATRQAMPPRQSVNAAYAPSEKHAESSAPSCEELNKRIEALSKELSILREELGKLKTHGAGTK